MQVKDLSKEEIKKLLLEGKTLRTFRHGSSEGNVQEGTKIRVTPRIGGREMKSWVYNSFEEWYAHDIKNNQDDEIEIFD